MNSQNKDILADHFVNVRGYKTRYWDVGFSDSIVVLIHGFSLSCEVWDRNIRELSKTHRVIALDFWGCGKTDATTHKPTVAEYPEFLIWFLDALKIKRAKFVGHSLGGLLAMQIAHNYPEYVEKLMLVGSAGFTRKVPFHFRLYSVPFVGEWIAKPSLKNLQHAFKYNVYKKGSVPEEYIDMLFNYSQKPDGAKHTLNLARSGMGMFGFDRKLIKEIKSKIKDIKCPVLLLWGKNDRILSHKSTVEAKKLMPHAKVELLEECGHLPQLEYPEQFNEIADKFLRLEEK